MIKHLLSAAAIVTVSACSAALPSTSLSAPEARTEAHAAPVAPQPAERSAPAAREALFCDIRTTPTIQGIRVQALLRSGRAITGDYRLVMTKIGRTGSADTEQSGPFSLSASGTDTLGESEISLERGASVRMRLTLSVDGVTVCQASRSYPQ